MRKGGGHYRATRKRVRVRYKQAPSAPHYEYVPKQKVVVYDPQVVYEPHVTYTPHVVYEARVVHKARPTVSHDYHSRPVYRPEPARPVYEGPVTTTEETVLNDYDGHGVLVYRPISRGHKHKRRRAHRAHHKAHYGHTRHKYRAKRHHRRRAAHVRHRKVAAPRYYHSAPAYHYDAHQPAQVYVVKRSRRGKIHKRTPLFGSKASYRRKVVRVRHRKRVHRRVCSSFAHVSHRKRRH